jgi:3-hydroxyphenylacetate 6-hydroxylase
LLDANSFVDPEIWSDPEDFRPERWLASPDAPLFTYGLGYRMCAGSLLANRELYLIFLRILGSFEIVADSEVDTHESVLRMELEKADRRLRAFDEA